MCLSVIKGVPLLGTSRYPHAQTAPSLGRRAPEIEVAKLGAHLLSLEDLLWPPVAIGKDEVRRAPARRRKLHLRHVLQELVWQAHFEMLAGDRLRGKHERVTDRILSGILALELGGAICYGVEVRHVLEVVLPHTDHQHRHRGLGGVDEMVDGIGGVVDALVRDDDEHTVVSGAARLGELDGLGHDLLEEALLLHHHLVILDQVPVRVAHFLDRLEANPKVVAVTNGLLAIEHAAETQDVEGALAPDVLHQDLTGVGDRLLVVVVAGRLLAVDLLILRLREVNRERYVDLRLGIGEVVLKGGITNDASRLQHDLARVDPPFLVVV
mmetsp:Transcript_60806/g.125272  ORF Transcript_60806/g.125272 Transcript_60806/m.125272 type:complete len:325 (-) Transcript_60806:799-1773(-)